MILFVRLPFVPSVLLFEKGPLLVGSSKRSFIAAYCRLKCDQHIQVFLLVFVNISEAALQ